jgi:hypothetical protein
VELLTVQVEDPAPPDMLVGLQLTPSPVVGLTEVDRVTVSAKPFWLVTVVVKLLFVPALNEILDGAAEMLKLGVDWCSRQAVSGCISQPL